MQEDISNMGKVDSIFDGICVVSGINRVAIDSVLLFPSGSKGLVIDFDDRICSAIIFGDYTAIKKGDYVKVADEQLKIPVGSELIGRIINPLGEPLDDLGDFSKAHWENIKNSEKSVFEREDISVQLETGQLIIDSQVPIGLGQRELFIGERRIGKEEVAMNVLINQGKNKSNIKVIYVAISTQTSFIKRAIEKITSTGTLANSIIVVARASDPAPLNYLAPLTGIRLAEELASRGEDVLIIFDNLTRHARVYRQISLLLKRAPGREAYPGDIFYLHSSLLERCGRFSKSVGGGSITAIPLVETYSDDITDYITTNLMSITDGHVLFQRILYHKDRRPAVSTEYSVSRIGGKTQKPVFRDLSNELKIQLSRFHEIESLTSFGTEIQQETSRLIERGKKFFAFTNQDQTPNIRLENQCVIIYFLQSDLVYRWPLEIMRDLSETFIKFIERPENQEKIITAYNLKSLDEAKPLYETLCQEFISDPETIRPLEEKELPADKENIQDILKGINQK